MDYYIPKLDEIKTKQSNLTIVFVFGGAWRSGSKDQYEFIASALTREGHRVLIPNYRLYPEATLTMFQTDIANAIAALDRTLNESQTGSTEQRSIVLMGHSSGAHQVALLFADKSHLRNAGVQSKIVGLIGLSGPYDLPLELEEVSTVFPNVQDELQVNPVLRAKHISANAYSSASVLLMHGTNDERVLPFHTTRFAEALKNAGIKTQVHLLDGSHAGVVISMAPSLHFLNDASTTVNTFLDSIVASLPATVTTKMP